MKNSVPPLPPLIRQHVEEARFLWDRRRDAATSSQYRLAHLIELERRLAAHLDGLQVAGSPGWDKSPGPATPLAPAGG